MSEYLAHDKANFTLNSTSFSFFTDYNQSLLYVIFFCDYFVSNMRNVPIVVIVWKKIKAFSSQKPNLLRFKCCRVKKVTLSVFKEDWEWLAMFFQFKTWDSMQTRIPLRFKPSQTLKRKREKIQSRALEATSTNTSTKCTLAKIISVQSGELLRYWVISFISSKMLPTNLIQLDNPPEIKFYAFCKVCHKKFKKILNIKKVSPNSRLDWELFRQCLALAQLESV